MYRWVQANTGGSIYTDELHERPDAGATFRVLDANGAEIASGAAAIDSVSTTLSAPAGSGSDTLSLTSATGVIVGRRYLLGVLEAEGGEWVTVKSVAGTTVTLVRPVRLSHASGQTFRSTRLTATVPGVSVTRPQRFCRVEFTYTVGGSGRPKPTVEFDVTRYTVRTGLTMEHLRDVDPLVLKRAAPGTHWPSLFDMAFERMMTVVAQQNAPGSLVGAIDLTYPHALFVLLMLVEQSYTMEAREMSEALRNRALTTLTTHLAAHAVDSNQDGAIRPNEGMWRTIRVVRG